MLQLAADENLDGRIVGGLFGTLGKPSVRSAWSSKLALPRTRDKCSFSRCDLRSGRSDAQHIDCVEQGVVKKGVRINR
jgi:hypothetical protein